ncbi:hypothetical protein Nepgr_000799 [Nepenthes gracilis]|uniref:DUF868 domain-containing protein n=1 Tax=Nepenthes gracilis TaxID=150966 RepID=A0AAD3P510_NEPGR|nr:hypothetical protein Nepgr_000799 [Nepenthes gracilis]
MTSWRHSYPFPSCFRPTNAEHHAPSPEPPPDTTGGSSTSSQNLTTCLYHTHLGIFTLTWSRSLFGRSLHLLHHPHHRRHPLPPSAAFSTTASLHLNIKQIIFWIKKGSRVLTFLDYNPKAKNIVVFWDLTRAKFGSGTEPESGFYIAVVADGEMALLVGDLEKEAYERTKAKMPRKLQALVIRREHVFGNEFYATKTKFGGKTTEISIECNANSDDPRLCIKFDQKKVLKIKHLKWKFRGSERIELDGQPIQLSWDVYNWLFQEENDEGYALFTFRFEKKTLFSDEEEGEEEKRERGNASTERLSGSDDSCGLNFERKKMKKRLLMKTRSSSSSSLSSSSSGCSSVMEWESVEENELKGPTGFSLLVYAWKS